jgi:tetratricopeptide (TPR) repeat protein
LKRLPKWQGGKLLLAMINLRRGQVEQGRVALEANLPLVIQLIRRDSDHGSTIAREVGQELALYDSSRPLAVRYYEAAMGNGRNQNGDYKQSLSRQIAELLKGMGRNEDARKVLNRFVESTLRENNRGFANSETVFLLGDDFVRLGYGADAVRIFRIMLSNRSAMNNSPETEKQLKKRLPETIALISPDSVGDLFKPLPKTNPNSSHDWIMPHGFSFGLPLRRLANSQESTKEDETDLGLTVSSRAELPGNLASTILDLTADIARHPALRQAAMNNIHAAREKSPDDIGLIIIAAQLAIVSNAENERLAAMSEVMESIARLPLPPTGDRQPTAKQRLEASRQVAVWLIAKQGLADKSLKGSAEKLAERALEAASFDADSTQSLAILHDWIRLAHDSKDEERVVQLLERLVDEIVHSRDGERKKGRAAEGAALASLDQFQKIANVARLATTLGHPQFGIKTLARTMRHGPPRETLGPADPENPFGQQDNINSQSSAQILREVHLLLELWSSSAITDMDRYELLRELVLPASQPARIYLYVDSSANIEHNWPRSLGNLLIIAAIKSGRVDEIRSLAAARLNQPLIELAARVFLGQIAVVTRDHDAAVEQLDFLIDRLSKDSLAQTGSLACHVVLPAMLTPELKAKSNQALAVIVSQLHKSIVSRRPSSSDQVALLTLLLARRYLQDGQDQQAIELLESWISLQSIVWANYDDASAARYRKGVYAQVAHEYAQLGNVDKMMEMLGRFADLPVTARYEEGIFDDAEATILNVLTAMETSNRYERLKKWTLPGKGRQNIRIFAGLIRSDHRPAAFEQLRGSAPADPARSRLTSTLEMLLDAARELDKLDELQREFKAASNDGGIDAACANAAIQIVRGQAADVLPELRKRNSADIEEDRYSQRDRTDRRTHDAILARLALQSSDASIREQGLAMGNWVTVSQRHLAADMRYAIAT